MAPTTGHIHYVLEEQGRKNEAGNAGRWPGEEQAPTASKLGMEGIILVGGTAVKRKRDTLAF